MFFTYPYFELRLFFVSYINRSKILHCHESTFFHQLRNKKDFYPNISRKDASH